MTLKRVPSVCHVCGSLIGNFLIGPDEDDGSSLPMVWCESCKQKSLLERGLIEAPRGELR
jgi:hypothetical protein